MPHGSEDGASTTGVTPSRSDPGPVQGCMELHTSHAHMHPCVRAALQVGSNQRVEGGAELQVRGARAHETDH